MKIIQESKTEIIVEYEREFKWSNDPEAGFGFKCDKDGNLINTNPAALENYRKCVSGEYDVIDKGIVKYSRKVKTPKIGLCSCGHEVPITAFTNTCDNCEADYNFNGDRLAPREQWGEDTGETWMECY